MKSILCLLITLTALAYQANGGSIGVSAKLGETIVLKFDESVHSIQTALPLPENGVDRKTIIEDGNITAYGASLKDFFLDWEN